MSIARTIRLPTLHSSLCILHSAYSLHRMDLIELSWPAVAALSKDTPVVFPIAALEQHGHHLPVFTDSMLLGEIIRRTAERFAQNILFTPLMWLGNSHHHLDFSGTLTAADDLPIANIRRLAQQRVEMVGQHGKNETEAATAHHLLAEQRDGPRLGAETFP